MLETIDIDPENGICACVIWLHGLGADGSDFVSLVPQLGLGNKGVRFVFPHAPVRRVTINGGMQMRAWYDIRRADFSREVDEAAIRESVAEITALVGREAERVSPQRIVLAGFSQGGVIALHAGVTLSAPVAGMLALSSYLAIPGTLAEEAARNNRSVPVFMGHGTQDPLVPLALAEAGRNQLVAAGYTVDFRRYAMAHAVCAEEVRDISCWLQARLDVHQDA